MSTDTIPAMLRRDGAPLTPAQIDRRTRAWSDLAHALWSIEPRDPEHAAAVAALAADEPGSHDRLLAVMDREGERWLAREQARAEYQKSAEGKPRFASWPHEVIGEPSLVSALEDERAENAEGVPA